MKKLSLLIFLSICLNSPSLAFYGELDFTLSDFCYQQPDVQNRNGVYYFPNMNKGITATSICVYANVYGQYQSKGKLKNGKFHGKHLAWYPTGEILSEQNYKDGERDGTQTVWYGGEIVAEDYYKDGVRFIVQ
jgi:antitoxin component YwqK of YwqJK toxin-antitoxin module